MSYPMPDHQAVMQIGEKIAKRHASAMYDDFVAPPYEAGVFVLDLLPLGQLGKIVFFEDDPDHAYTVSFGAMALSGRDAPELARSLR